MFDRFQSSSSIGKIMQFGTDFWKDFGGCVKEKSKHVGLEVPVDLVFFTILGRWDGKTSQDRSKQGKRG